MGDSADAGAQTAEPKAQETQQGDWIIKLWHRKDQRKYYLHESGSTTTRVDNLMRLSEDDAKQLAYALRTQHPDFTARAMKCPKRFTHRTPVKKNPKTVSVTAVDPRLRDCPFCGGVAEVVEVKDGPGRRMFAVRCSECSCGTVYLKTRAAATGRWNARKRTTETKGGGNGKGQEEKC